MSLSLVRPRLEGGAEVDATSSCPSIFDADGGSVTMTMNKRVPTETRKRNRHNHMIL